MLVYLLTVFIASLLFLWKLVVCHVVVRAVCGTRKASTAWTSADLTDLRPDTPPHERQERHRQYVVHRQRQHQKCINDLRTEMHSLQLITHRSSHSTTKSVKLTVTSTTCFSTIACHWQHRRYTGLRPPSSSGSGVVCTVFMGLWSA